MESPQDPPSGPGAAAWIFGIFSLIPFLGVFFSVVAITLGILRWKRGGKFIVTLGVAGILVTGALSGYLYHRFSRPANMFSEKVYRQATERQLNECVKAIEYFHQTEGKYPADLQALQAKNKDLSIADMTSWSSWRNIQTLMYDLSLSGDTYYLFARGKDREAFTADDILPAVTEEERSRIGYRDRPLDFTALVASPVPGTNHPASSSDPLPTTITWLTPTEGEAEAKRTGKPTLIDITAEWCGPCRRLNAEVFEDATHAPRIARAFVTVRALDRRREEGKNPDDVQKVEEKYLNRGFPTVVVVKADGSFDRLVGFNGADAVMEFFKKNGME